MFKLSRRQFAASAIAGIAFGGFAERGLAGTRITYRNEVRGFGPLVADHRGLFDLPKGFSYRVISRAGEPMDDGFITPGNFDGMGCFPLGSNRVALVRNHELKLESRDRGPTGGLA
ncbi:MAG TPA: alkaline phosphatase PhoX, partial [Tepidisphaeraceae bacterium]